MGHTYTKKEALRIMIAAAKDYAALLEGMNYLFIYRNRENNQIKYFETLFLPRNFQHLTGMEFVNKEGILQKNAVYFYRKCLTNSITEQEICFRKDGTSPLKLEALPKLVRFLRFSKMTAFYNGARPRLAVERLAGTASCCFGFVKEKDYYVPASCLLEDIRKLGDKPSQVLAVLSKKAHNSQPVYQEILYTAKGLNLSRLKLTGALNQLVFLPDCEKTDDKCEKMM